MKAAGNPAAESEIRDIAFLAVEMLAGGRLLLCLTCMASPSRGGNVPSRPQAGGAGRANSASFYRMAPVWPHIYKQVMMLGTPKPSGALSPIATPNHSTLSAPVSRLVWRRTIAGSMSPLTLPIASCAIDVSPPLLGQA
jgi:hypothetical protein